MAKKETYINLDEKRVVQNEDIFEIILNKIKDEQFHLKEKYLDIYFKLLYYLLLDDYGFDDSVTNKRFILTEKAKNQITGIVGRCNFIITVDRIKTFRNLYRTELLNNINKYLEEHDLEFIQILKEAGNSTLLIEKVQNTLKERKEDIINMLFTFDIELIKALFLRYIFGVVVLPLNFYNNLIHLDERSLHLLFQDEKVKNQRLFYGFNRLPFMTTWKEDFTVLNDILDLLIRKKDLIYKSIIIQQLLSLSYKKGIEFREEIRQNERKLEEIIINDNEFARKFNYVKIKDNNRAELMKPQLNFNDANKIIKTFVDFLNKQPEIKKKFLNDKNLDDYGFIPDHK